MAKSGATQMPGGGAVHPSLADLFEEMWSWVLANRRNAALAAAAAIVLATFITLLIPRDYVATMVVTPVESSLTDPSTLMSAPGFAIRTPFSLNDGPPPQMAAFIKLLKSPEVARKLTQNPQAMQAIGDASGSWLGAVMSIFPAASRRTKMPKSIAFSTGSPAISRWIRTSMSGHGR